MSNLAIPNLVRVCSLAALLFAGSTIAGEAPSESGFIDNVPELTPVPDMEGAYIWETPGFSAAEYTRLLLDPIEVFIHEDSKYDGVAPAEMLTVTSALRAHIIDALEPDYPLVNKPGPGVAHVRMAITGLKLEKEPRKAKGVFGVIPIGFAVNVVQEAIGRDILLTDATMEAEFRDAVSGKRVVVVLDSAALRRGDAQPSWESLDAAFQLYASRIRQRLDSARKQ